MGKYLKENAPDPFHYYADIAGLTFQQSRGKWRNVACFNCDSNGMRINTETGGFICMAGCGARGGDVLAYHRALHGMGFVEAARALGAYIDDGTPYTGRTRPTAIPAREMLQCVEQDLMQCASVLSRALNGKPIYDDDYASYRGAASRVIYVAGLAA